jgi:hypothetical protein
MTTPFRRTGTIPVRQECLTYRIGMISVRLVTW